MALRPIVFRTVHKAERRPGPPVVADLRRCAAEDAPRPQFHIYLQHALANRQRHRILTLGRPTFVAMHLGRAMDVVGNARLAFYPIRKARPAELLAQPHPVKPGFV